MKTIIKLALITFIFTGNLNAGNLKVIVDTDTAPDDMRAIAIMLAAPEIDVLAVITSDGALPPEEGASKVSQMLELLNRSDIPVFAGRELAIDPPVWRDFCRNVIYRNSIFTDNTIPAKPIFPGIVEVFKSEPAPVTIVCLGPLTNPAEILELLEIPEAEIEGFIWYSDWNNGPSGSNFLRDTLAARAVMEHPLPVTLLSSMGMDGCEYDPIILAGIDSLHTPEAEFIASIHSQPEVQARLQAGHLKLWDDLIPVYLLHPELFEMQHIAGNVTVSAGFQPAAVKTEIMEILEREDHHHLNVIFDDFPEEPELFQEDLRPLVHDIIDRYGEEEWRTVALTLEFHRHLGIYTLIGAKMGLNAQAYFGVVPDEMTVVSHAGLEPPVSCLNDGLQVSTGATLGHGTISIASGNVSPAAVFNCRGEVLKLKLKDDLREQVKNDIREGIRRYGNLTPEYFAFVRELALKYWLEFDRNQIFEIE